MAEEETTKFPLPQRLYEFTDVVVEQFEVIVEPCFAADRRVEHDDRRARFLRDEVGGFPIEVGLHDDRFDALLLNQIDDLERVRRRWRNARLRLNRAGNFETKVAGEVRP